MQVDRHAHIGKGEIGLEGFTRLLKDERFTGIPALIETPEGEKMHKKNLALLRKLRGDKRRGNRIVPAGR